MRADSKTCLGRLMVALAVLSCAVAAHAGSPFDFQVPRAVFIGPHPGDVLDRSTICGGDLNGDGLLDVVAAGSRGDGGHVTTLLGDGEGNLEIHGVYAVGTGPVRVVVSDLDRDGALDAVTANRDGASLTALLGDGSGGFASSASIDLGGSPYDLVAGDFDGDGLPDLAVVLFEQGRIEVLLGDGDGGFSGIGGPALFLDYGSRIIAADLDRDGRADLAVSADDVLTSLLGNGDGTFRIGPVFSASAPVGDLAVSDLDEDGNPDVVGTDGGAESRIVVLLGDGTGAFTEGEGLTATHVTSLTIADLDGDGHQDVVLRASAGLVWARGDGQGRFEPPRRAGGVSSYLVRPGIVVGDMNGDGANDAVLAGESGPGILLADCPGEFSRPRSIPHEYPLGGTAAGDFDEDGRLDLALTDQGENSTDWGSWTVRLGTGTGDFGDPVVTEVEIGEGPPRPMLVYVADMNLDGHEDLVLGGGYSSVAHVLVGDGTGSFEVLQDCSAFLGVTQRELSIRDFNGDGWPDVAGLGWGYDRLCVVLSDGSGGFLPVSNFDTDPNSIALVDIDVDQDGDIDLALSHYVSPGLISVFENDGSGSFSQTMTRAVDGVPQDIARGDFTGDGIADLAVAVYSPGTVSLLVGDGSGSFLEEQSIDVGFRGPLCLGVADLDLDGHDDLVAIHWSRFAVLRSDGTSSFPASIENFIGAGSGGLCDVIAADFYQDGYPDLLLSATLLVNRGRSPVAARRGNVNALGGAITDVLFVNDRSGAEDGRRVVLGTDESLTLRIVAPPSLVPGTARYVIYAWRGEPGDSSLWLPHALGPLALPCALVPTCRPQPARVANLLGHAPLLGTHRWPGGAPDPAPATLLALPSGVGREATFTVQGLVEDTLSIQGQLAVTNGVVVEIR